MAGRAHRGRVLSLSPMVVVLSGTFLPYSFQLLVQVLFVYLVLSGIRLGSAPRLVFAGVALGVAAFARPFDALARRAALPRGDPRDGSAGTGGRIFAGSACLPWGSLRSSC